MGAQTRYEGLSHATAKVALIFSVTLAALPGTTWAQNQQADGGPVFNFSTLGARSLGMGGAFVGVADDATAAYTNPAGLTNLIEEGPQVAVELGGQRFTNTFLDGGHFGRPTGIGIDNVAGLRSSESQNEVTALPFVSIVYLLPKGFSLAIYRNELANFKSATQSQGAFFDSLPDSSSATLFCPTRDSIGGAFSSVRLCPSQESTDLSVENFGLSAAYAFKIGPGKLSMGLGLLYYQTKLRAEANDFFVFPVTPGFPSSTPGQFYGSPNFEADRLYTTSILESQDGSPAFSVGWLWQSGGRQSGNQNLSRHGSWSLGGVLRRGAELESGVKITAQRMYSLLSHGDDKHIGEVLGREAGVFTIPDVLGIGMAYATRSGRSRVSLDYDRVQYSQRSNDQTLMAFPRPLSKEDLHMKDADEAHLGVEHTFQLMDTQMLATLRAGAWYAPFHGLEYRGHDALNAARIGKQGEDDVHFSLGLGLSMKKGLQIDAAAEVSDRVQTVAVSLAQSF